MDEDEVRPTPVHDVGMALDALSIDELRERVELLRGEIARIEEAIEAKSASRSAADAVFRF